MTPTTVGAGYLLIGVFLMCVGYGIVRLAASAWAERRVKRVRAELSRDSLAYLMEQRESSEFPTPLPVTKFNDLAYRQHIADAQARIEASNVVPMPGLRVVQQREGSE